MIKTVSRRITHGEILTLPTVPIPIAPTPPRPHAVLFITGRVQSHIVTPYEGISTEQAWLSLRRAESEYDESSYIYDDPNGEPDNPTYLTSLLSESNEFGLVHGSFVVNATYQVMSGMWFSGNDFKRGLDVGITNGWPSANLTGGHERNYLDIIAVYAEFSL